MIFVSIFFFKQKTAYEMRISDWSSDVCSSDLPLRRRPQSREQAAFGPAGQHGKVTPSSMTDEASTASPGDLSDKPQSSKHKVDLRDEHTKVLVRRLVRDYVAEHKGRILLALLGMAIVAGPTAAFTQLIKDRKSTRLNSSH